MRSSRLLTTSLLLLFAVVAVAQNRIVWRLADDVETGQDGSAVGAVIHVDPEASAFEIITDEDTSRARIRVSIDGATEFHEHSEPGKTLLGAAGLAALRDADRVEVRGHAMEEHVIAGETVILLGRAVAPPEVPAGTPAAAKASPAGDRIEGTVRSVDASESRIVVQNDAGDLVTLYATETTPVNYHGSVFRVRNLEIGDRIVAKIDEPGTDEAVLRAIDVISSVSHDGKPAAPRRPETPEPEAVYEPLEIVEIEGSVDRFEDQILAIVDSSNAIVIVTADEDLVVTGRAANANVSDLVEGNAIEVRAFRVGDRLIAQTIRTSD